MKIQKGLVKYKDRSDIVCTYGITDDGRQYYFINDRKLSNNNIIVTSALVEAIDHSVVPANIGVINSEGNIVIDCVNKSIKLITKDILLVEKANPTSPSVVEALKNRKDPLAATKLVSNSAAIKEKMAAQMGSDARFIFNDQFSEASLFDIGGKNLLNDKYYSFIALNKRGDTIFLSDNVQTSGVDSLSLTSMKFNDTTNVDAGIPSNLNAENRLDVTAANVNKDNIDAAMNDNISKLGDDTVSTVPPVVDDVPAVPAIPSVPDVPAVPSVPAVPAVPAGPVPPVLPVAPVVPDVPEIPPVPQLPSDNNPSVPTGVVVPAMNPAPTKSGLDVSEDGKINIPPVTGDLVDDGTEEAKEETKETPKEEVKNTVKENLKPGANQFINSDGKIVIPARAIQDYQNQDEQKPMPNEEEKPEPKEENNPNRSKIINDGSYIAIPAKAIEEFSRGEVPSSLDSEEPVAKKPEKKETTPEEKVDEVEDDENVNVVDISIAGAKSQEEEKNVEEPAEEEAEEESKEETKEEVKDEEKVDDVEESKKDLISSDLLADLVGNKEEKPEKKEEPAAKEEVEESKEEIKEEAKKDEPDDDSEEQEESEEEAVEEAPKEIDDEPVKIDDDSTVEDLLNGSSDIDDFLNSDTSSVLDDTYRYVPKKNSSITSSNANIMDNAVDTITRLIEANKNQKNELNQYKNQVTELTDLNKKVVDKARSDREKVKSSIQNYEVEITKLKAQMETLESKINEKESTIKNQTKELADLRTQVEGSNNLAKVLADAQSLLGE